MTAISNTWKAAELRTGKKSWTVRYWWRVASVGTSFHPRSSPLIIGARASTMSASCEPRWPHICWNCTRISLKVSVMTAMKTFFTSQLRKKIIVVKYMKARQAGSVSMARYMMKTHPSWENAWYTVKMLVANGQKKKYRIQCHVCATTSETRSYQFHRSH